MEVSTENGTIKDLIVAKTAKIGEKLSLRRFQILTLKDGEVFGSYIHMGGKIASLVVLKGANEEVAKELAMGEGKPAEIAEKMVEGRMHKFYKEICLVEQAFIKDGGLSVNQYIKNNGGELKTAIRYEVGEGMEKRNDDFASEVMNQVKGN